MGFKGVRYLVGEFLVGEVWGTKTSSPGLSPEHLVLSLGAFLWRDRTSPRFSQKPTCQCPSPETTPILTLAPSSLDALVAPELKEAIGIK